MDSNHDKVIRSQSRACNVPQTIATKSKQRECFKSSSTTNTFLHDHTISCDARRKKCQQYDNNTFEERHALLALARLQARARRQREALQRRGLFGARR